MSCGRGPARLAKPKIAASRGAGVNQEAARELVVLLTRAAQRDSRY